MELEFLNENFSICKLEDMKNVNWEEEFFCVSKTDAELTLICRTSAVPKNTINREDGYIGFRVKGELDFSLTGILSALAATLSEGSIPIFAISTYNTDYILIKKEYKQKAQELLLKKGYRF